MREGVPLAAVLETGRRVREHADAMALLFTELISTHIAQDALTRLRPLAKSVVEAELTMAMDRLLASAAGSPGSPGAAGSAGAARPAGPAGQEPSAPSS